MVWFLKMCMDRVCARFPPEIGDIIARYVHQLLYADVMHDLRTRVIRIVCANGAFMICNNDNYYQSLIAVENELAA